MGGIGKTTLAKALFDSISDAFEYTCFLRDVKKLMGNSGDPDYLRGAIKKSILRKGYRVGNNFNWEALRGKKVLIMLDDVKHESHIQVMLEADGFSESSCVIVTSRDSSFFIAERFKPYSVEPLDQENCRRLFFLMPSVKKTQKKKKDISGVLSNL
jgi:probable WRKY transcription factor 52